MAKMGTCACGWTVISPVGEEDVLMHVRIHLNEHHPGTKITEGELRNLIRSI
ncbi:MAG: hypothetical protein OK439_01470 [Thaumarchaeota archaeon]|nr:hypothetical protein [Nitrososphaerota archaeon]